MTQKRRIHSSSTGRATALTLTPTPSEDLPRSKVQMQFNRLVSKVEALQRKIASKTADCEQALKDYAKIYSGPESAEDLRRKHLIRELGEVWRQPRALGKIQRSNLRDYLLDQFDLLRPPKGEVDDEYFLKLFEDLRADVRSESSTAAPTRPQDPLSSEAFDLLLKKLFDPEKLAEMGYDPEMISQIDFSRFVPTLDPEKLFQEFLRQEKEWKRKRGPAPAGQEESTSTAHERTQEPRAAEEEAKRRSLVTLFKQLAKVLHPDLEQDPEKRQEKVRLMQQATEAYRNGDMFTLLRLEMEHLHKQQRDLTSLDEEKLALYCGVLKEQLEQLNFELLGVTSQPRFSSIQEYLFESAPRMPNWKRKAQDSLRKCEVLDNALLELTRSPQNKKEEIRRLVRLLAERKRDLKRFGRYFL